MTWFVMTTATLYSVAILVRLLILRRTVASQVKTTPAFPGDEGVRRSMTRPVIFGQEGGCRAQGVGETWGDLLTSGRGANQVVNAIFEDSVRKAWGVWLTSGRGAAGAPRARHGPRSRRGGGRRCCRR